MADIRNTYKAKLKEILEEITFTSNDRFADGAIEVYDRFTTSGTKIPFVFIVDSTTNISTGNSADMGTLRSSSSYMITYQFIIVAVFKVGAELEELNTEEQRMSELEGLMVDKLLSKDVRDGVAYSAGWHDLILRSVSSPVNGLDWGLDKSYAAKSFIIDIEAPKAYN